MNSIYFKFFFFLFSQGAGSCFYIEWARSTWCFSETWLVWLMKPRSVDEWDGFAQDNDVTELWAVTCYITPSPRCLFLHKAAHWRAGWRLPSTKAQVCSHIFAGMLVRVEAVSNCQGQGYDFRKSTCLKMSLVSTISLRGAFFPWNSIFLVAWVAWKHWSGSEDFTAFPTSCRVRMTPLASFPEDESGESLVMFLLFKACSSCLTFRSSSWLIPLLPPHCCTFASPVFWYF